MRLIAAAVVVASLISFSPAVVSAQDEPAPEPTPAGEGDEGQDDPEARREAERKAKEELERQEAERQERQKLHDSLREAATDVLHAQDVDVDDQGRLSLRYAFDNAEAWEDWENSGFEQPGRTPNQRLAVNARGGLVRHRLELAGDFQVEIQLRILRTSTESDLVVGVGKAGARYGTQLVKRRSRGFAPVSRRSQVDRTPFAGGRSTTIVLRREGGTFSAKIGDSEVATSELSKEAEGVVLLFGSDISLELQSVKILAVVDSDQIYKLGFE